MAVTPRYEILVVVTGIALARQPSKYAGQVSGLYVSAYSNTGTLVELGQVTGLSERQRQEITNTWYGTVIRIRTSGFTRKQRLRHARYVRQVSNIPSRSVTVYRLLMETEFEPKPREQMRLGF